MYKDVNFIMGKFVFLYIYKKDCDLPWREEILRMCLLYTDTQSQKEEQKGPLQYFLPFKVER